jgi:hypothetical protein
VYVKDKIASDQQLAFTFVAGLVCFFFALVYCPMHLWTSEQFYVDQQLAFNEADAQLQFVGTGATPRDAQLREFVETTDFVDNKSVVYFNSPFTGSTTDPDFGIELDDLAIKRETQYCQWKENSNTHCSKACDNCAEICVTSYSYSKSW